MEKNIILITGRNEYTRINIDEVVYLKADGNYTHIKLTSEKKITICKSLKKSIEEIFNYDEFLKIKRDIVINIRHIDFIKTGKKSVVILCNNEKFKPSSRFKFDKNMFIK